MHHIRLISITCFNADTPHCDVYDKSPVTGTELCLINTLMSYDQTTLQCAELGYRVVQVESPADLYQIQQLCVWKYPV